MKKIILAFIILGAGTLAGPAQAQQPATRNTPYWFTHAISSNPACATLYNAMQAAFNASNQVDLGFVQLPVYYDDQSYYKDAEDVLMEALGFYYLSAARTGELGGRQGAALPASRLCRLRKPLAVELISAIANVAYLGANPSSATYVNKGVVTAFPPDLLQQALNVIATEDPVQTAAMTVLLRQFNQSGMRVGLPLGLEECNADSAVILRRLARDPTTQLTCPGVNNSCDTAEALFFPASNSIYGIYSPAGVTAAVSMNKSLGYGNFFGNVDCGSMMNYAVWKLLPVTASVNRSFTIDTFGSNVDTILAVFQGDCSTSTVAVACNDDAPLPKSVFSSHQSKVTFTSDGVSTYYIVAGLKGTNSGSVQMSYGGVIRLTVRSP